ncbi:CPBP family intramembrane glutamic endopeptidase [Pontimicrobium sp. MEBiC01747]
MQSTLYKSIEFFLLFIIVPISFVIEFPVWIKMVIGLLGFLYVVFLLLRVEKETFKLSKGIDWKTFFKYTLLKLFGIALLTLLYVYFTNASNLFIVLIENPILWIKILFIYSFLSVYPQELIYRTFYFKRYEALFINKKQFLFINAIVFSLAHLFFKNTLVIVLTFFGGLLFAFTYNKTRSTVLVSIEHAIYGCWLFTVGMGEMLGFPSSDFNM